MRIDPVLKEQHAISEMLNIHKPINKTTIRETAALILRQMKTEIEHAQSEREQMSIHGTGTRMFKG